MKDLDGKYVELTGLCEEPHAPDKTITIDSSIGDKELLKTAIDESIHACCWPLDNDYVDQMSEAMGELLWRMGYRRLK